MIIKNISALEVLDSRGRPTVLATVNLNNGTSASAMVPSGASTGSHEALELRDEDPKRYFGKGVLKAISNIENIISPALVGISVDRQAEIDQIMIDLDATSDKSNLGANAILAVSLATSRAAAASLKIPLYAYLSRFNLSFDGCYILPRPMMNVLNGGSHANFSCDIQEYMILPLKAKSISEAIRLGAEVYEALKRVLKEKNYSLLVGDEGGFAPAVKNNEEPFILLKEAVELAGYRVGDDFAFAIDAAASEFFKQGKYELKKENKILSSENLGTYFENLIDKYPIVSLEDVFDEDDWQSFALFSKKYPHLQIVGDDLYVTSLNRLKKGIELSTTNSILIKLNQIGTLSETIAVINLAHQSGMTTVVSHRSGETEDSYIADFAVAMGSGQIKTGSLSRSERLVKYNRLIQIESELGAKARLLPWPHKLK